MDELSMMVKVGFTKLKVIKTKNEEIENSKNCICWCLKSLIKQKLESNLGREITNRTDTPNKNKPSWVRGWVRPNLTINHQVISSITETRANLLARKKFRGSSAKFNNEKDRSGITSDLESVCCQATGKQRQFVKTRKFEEWLS